MTAPIKSEEYEVVSGGSSDPKILSGVVDPSTGEGVAAPEGSVYLRYVSAAGEAWWKSGTGDTDWGKIGSGDGGGETAVEKSATFDVNIGASTQEETTGRATFSGSLIGLSVHAEEVTVAGTITVSVKVNAVTKLTAVLESVTNTEYNLVTAPVGTHALVQGDEVTVEVIGNASYDNTSSGLIGVVVGVTTTVKGYA